MRYFASILHLSTYLYLLCQSALYATPFCENYWSDKLYVELGGSLTSGLSTAAHTVDAIIITNRMGIDAISSSGWQVEGKLGYKLLPYLRIAASYSFFPADYSWTIVSGANQRVEVANAHLHIQTLLLNAYLQLDRLYSSSACCRVSPYFMGGIGESWNHLGEVESMTINGNIVVEAETISKHSASHFAGRFGIGILTCISSWCYCDTGIYATYIGTIQTGRHTSNHLSPTFHPYIFRNNWLGSIYLGLNCCF